MVTKYHFTTEKTKNTGKIRKKKNIRAKFFFFKLKGKDRELSRAENPLARAMAQASLARTHHYYLCLVSVLTILNPDIK